MPKQKTHEEYVAELAIKNPNVEVVDTYVNAKTKITHHCLIHDVYWKVLPYAPLRGHGCPMCHSERIHDFKTKSHEQYVEELYNVNKDICVLERYIDINTPILHKCIKHDVVWKSSPWNLLNGCGCYECGIEKSRKLFAKTHEQYVKEVYDINKNIVVLGKYINNNTAISHRCLVCGNEWQTRPINILNGCGCPRCSMSRGERFIEHFLDNNNIEYIQQKTFENCKDKQPLSFDFYLPDYNIVIEYQGKQHYQPVEIFGGQQAFEKQQIHDNIKRDYCTNNGIKLLEIPYYANIEKELNNFLFI